MANFLNKSLIWILIFGFWISAVGCGVDLNTKTITVSPSSKSIGLNKTQQFYATAFDAQGTTLSRTFTWSVEGSIGTINASGLLTSGGTETTGYIVASVDGVSGRSSITLTTKGVVGGKVRNILSNQIGGIVVSVASLSATTNSTGDYTINNLPYGTVEVITRENLLYLATSLETFVRTGETTAVNITLLDRFSVTNENISGDPISVSGKVFNNGSTSAIGVVVIYNFFDATGNPISSQTQSLGTIPSLGSVDFTLSPTPIISSYSTVTRVISATSI